MKTKLLDYQKIKDSFLLAATIEGRSRRTLELYEQTLKIFEAYIKPKTVLETTPQNIRGFILELQRQGQAKTTIFTHIKELRVFYNFLVAEGYLEKSPLANIKSPKLPRCYPYVLSEEDVLKLLRVIRGKTLSAKRNYSMILFFLDIGVRVSELCNLTLDDVCLATYTAKVRGKGDKERTVHFGKETAKALACYLKKRGFIPHEDTFFVSEKGDKLRRDSILKILKRLGEKAGI